jgi:ribosomal protein L11 methyltransferase
MEPYTELNIEADNDTQEMLIAELSELHFDNFTQEDNTLVAYALSNHYILVKKDAEEIIEKYKARLISTKEIENNINWNKQWEENFEPIIIGDVIYVRALFHEPRLEFKHEIIIQPKMSFGTGHHETTQLMMELMLERDFKQAVCLDMGCGTGVLAILAEQLGAEQIIAIDFDQWCFENTEENFTINEVLQGTVILGDSTVLANEVFLDLWLPYSKRIILSNITKNYNMGNLSIYHNISEQGTVILLSGFYETDLQDLINEGNNYGMKFVKSKTRNNWCAAVFEQQ